MEKQIDSFAKHGLSSEINLNSYRTEGQYGLSKNKSSLKLTGSQVSVGRKLTPKYLENKYKKLERLPDLERDSQVMQNKVTGAFIK